MCERSWCWLDATETLTLYEFCQGTYRGSLTVVFRCLALTVTFLPGILWGIESSILTLDYPFCGVPAEKIKTFARLCPLSQWENGAEFKPSCCLSPSCKCYALHSAKMLRCISCQSWNFWANCWFVCLVFFYSSTPWLCHRGKDTQKCEESNLFNKNMHKTLETLNPKYLLNKGGVFCLVLVLLKLCVPLHNNDILRLKLNICYFPP